MQGCFGLCVSSPYIWGCQHFKRVKHKEQSLINNTQNILSTLGPKELQTLHTQSDLLLFCVLQVPQHVLIGIGFICWVSTFISNFRIHIALHINEILKLCFGCAFNMYSQVQATLKHSLKCRADIVHCCSSKPQYAMIIHQEALQKRSRCPKPLYAEPCSALQR